MTWAELQDMTSEQLVARFVTLASSQDRALLMDDIAKVNHLYRQLKEVESELKAREDLIARHVAMLPEARVGTVRH